MDTSSFTSASPGELIKNLDGQWTFLPAPLPPEVTWTTHLIHALAHTSQTLGELAALLRGRTIDPQRILRLTLRREAEFSSRIENTYASVQTMLLFEQTPAVEAHAPDVREVENNFKALQYGLAAVEHRPISLGLLKEMHQILLEGVRGHDRTPGEFRKVQAHIGRTSRIEDARFVPPPHHKIEESMRQLEQYIQNPDALPALVRVALIHYQFEAIHPFSDGNGRIGRVLILMLMCSEKLLRTPVLNPSAYLEANRREYYDQLLAVSQQGAWSDWIEFIITGIGVEARMTIDRLQRLEKLRRRYHDVLQAIRASVLAARLVDHLFADPSITLQQAAQVLQTSKQAAQKVIDRMLKAGILRETTGMQRNRIYLAQEIVDTLTAPPEESGEAA